MEKINHELNEYNYVEGIEFTGLMPQVMDVEGIETIGKSIKSVKHMGFEAKGNDQLEVIDIEALYETQESGEDNG